LSSPASRKSPSATVSWQKKREELARVLERLEAPDVRPGLATELRHHHAVLETEIAEPTVMPRRDDQP
jgi:hypothetical protein